MKFDTDFWRELEHLRLLARRLYAPSRVKRLKRIGSGLELADRRSYTQGDELRYIDWKYYARSEKLNLRLFEDERDLLYLIVLDSSESMSGKFDAAARIALALTDLALNAGDRVVFALAFDETFKILSESKGAAATQTLAPILESARTSGKTLLLRSIGYGIDTIKGVQAVVIISDFFDPDYRSVLSFVQSHSLPQILVALHSEIDRNFTSELKDFRLIDSETNEKIEISIDESVRRAYEEEFERFRRELQEAAQETGTELVFAESESSFKTPVERLLSLGYFLP